jgi:Tfp pilus assembly protein PilV
LVEVLVATVILAIGLLGALTAFSMAARVTGRSAQDTAVTLLAQEKLAAIMIDGRAGKLTPGMTQGDFGADRPGYSWRLVVSAPDEGNVSRVGLTIYSPGLRRRNETRFETAVFPSTVQ